MKRQIKRHASAGGEGFWESSMRKHDRRDSGNGLVLSLPEKALL